MVTTILRSGNEWMVLRSTPDNVKAINRQLSDAKAKLGGNHRDILPLSECILVANRSLGMRYLVLVRHFDVTHRDGWLVPKLVKFSERRFAPSTFGEVRLSTPAYHRRVHETLGAGIGDAHDGLLTADATPLVRRLGRIDDGVVADLQVSFSIGSQREPWVYCTSVLPASDRKRRELAGEFPRYDSATEIQDPNAFAIQLAVDCAIAIEESTHFEFDGNHEMEVVQQGSWSGELCHNGRQIDRYVDVHHGPVIYEDESGVLESPQDVYDLWGPMRECFTKKVRFSKEREYRFAVSVVGGRPQRGVLDLVISDELRVFFSACASTKLRMAEGGGGKCIGRDRSNDPGS